MIYVLISLWAIIGLLDAYLAVTHPQKFVRITNGFLSLMWFLLVVMGIVNLLSGVYYMTAACILLVLHLILTILYGRLAYIDSSWPYGICAGCWFLCLVLDIIRLSLL